MFTGRNDGRFVALDASNGSVLWQFQTGAGVNAPATVFEHAGEQYVVVYSAGNLFAGSRPGDSLWLFGLDGRLGPADPPIIGPRDVRPEGADIDAGRSIYAMNCAQCHGENLEGGHGGGPALAGFRSFPGAVGVIVSGRNRMPPFSSVLSATEVRDVSAFLVAAPAEPPPAN